MYVFNDWLCTRIVTLSWGLLCIYSDDNAVVTGSANLIYRGVLTGSANC